MTRTLKDFRSRVNARHGRNLGLHTVAQNQSFQHPKTMGIQLEIGVESGIEVELTLTSRARKRAPSSSGTTFTEGAVLRLGKRRKIGDLDTMVRRWAESACGRVSEAVL
jgi:hypothetical protein